MALYNSLGQINTTLVSGSSRTGLTAADGSLNIVLNQSNTGLYHPCGAYNAVVVNSPTGLSTNGNAEVIAGSSPSGFVLTQPSGTGLQYYANPGLTGFAAGSPGTSPNSWSVRSSPTGLTRTLSTGTTNGISWVDFNFTGTTGNTGSFQFQFNTSGSTANVPALTGQTWTSGIFFMVSQDDPSLTSVSNQIWSFQSNGTTFVNNANVTPFDMYSTRTTWKFYSGNLTLNNAAIGTISNVIVTNNFPITTLINVTFRFGYPSLIYT